MRRHAPALAALLLAIAGLSGCENGKTTNPKDLPALTASDLEEIKQKDAEIADEERGQVFVVNGKGKNAKGKKAAQ